MQDSTNAEKSDEKTQQLLRLAEVSSLAAIPIQTYHRPFAPGLGGAYRAHKDHEEACSPVSDYQTHALTLSGRRFKMTVFGQRYAETDVKLGIHSLFMKFVISFFTLDPE